jgi:cell division protein FtsL
MPGVWINSSMKKMLIQYLWLIAIAIVLAGAAILITGCTLSEQDQITRDFEKIDKQLEKEKNDSNK